MENELKESIFYNRIRSAEYENVNLNDFMSGNLHSSKSNEKMFKSALENFQARM